VIVLEILFTLEFDSFTIIFFYFKNVFVDGIKWKILGWILLFLNLIF